MTKTFLIYSRYSILAIPLFLMIACVSIVQFPFFNENQSTLSWALTIDLAILIPLIYLVSIRNKTIPKTTVVPIFIIGMAVATAIIPREHQQVLQWLKTWLLPVIELFILIYINAKLYFMISRLKQEKRASSDFFNLVKKVCKESFGDRLHLFLATEIAVFYYGLMAWRKKHLKNNEFSYHKNTGSAALLVAIIIIILIETFVLHQVLMKWNALVAWIIFGISIYTILQFFAILKSLPYRPIRIENNELHLRYGMLNETVISIDHISKLEFTTKEFERESTIKRLSPLGVAEGHNIIVHLDREYKLNGLYGLKKAYTSIAFNVDEKEAFKNKITPLLNK